MTFYHIIRCSNYSVTQNLQLSTSSRYTLQAYLFTGKTFGRFNCFFIENGMASFCSICSIDFMNNTTTNTVAFCMTILTNLTMKYKKGTTTETLRGR